MRIITFTGCFLLMHLMVEAQSLWVNKGVDIAINPGTEIVVFGDLRIDSSSRFFNSGQLHLEGSIYQNGNLQLDGDLYVRRDILNEGNIVANNSTLELNGTQQTISGSGETRLYRLRLSGQGEKYADQDLAMRYLDLHNSLLFTRKNKARVDDESPLSITRETGYVISDSGGALYRAIQPGAEYLFPLGSENIYAPAWFSTLHEADTAGLRFVHSDANLDGLSRNYVGENICFTNADFYTQLYRSDTAAANLRLHYPLTYAHTYNTLLSTPSDTTVFWDEQNPANLTVSDSVFTIATQTRGNKNKAFLLARTRPEQPQVTGDDSICVAEQVLFNASPSAIIHWVAGGGILSIEDDKAYFMASSAGQSFISASLSDTFGCSSLSSEKLIEVMPFPGNDLLVQYPEFPYENQVFSLNYAGADAEQVYWYQDGIPAGSGNALQIQFDAPGAYLIRMDVFNEYGCSNTRDTLLHIVSGLELPDSFSPNDDGINDELNFLNSGLQRFDLKIYNRWGALVFSSVDAKFNWDGRNQNGEKVLPGTYFYVLDVEFQSHKAARHKGTVAVVY